MAIRLVTKTGGRLSARVHSAFFHLAKGNSLKEKPYGIVPTKDYEDPFGLVFDNTELKVRIKPGQFSCYGRQCIVTEETEAVRMGDVYLTSDKLYMTVYARVDLNDQVFQKVDIRYAYNTEAHVDFPKRQMAQNLYRKTNGLYDVPLARFVFHQNPTTPNEYFTDYEKVIETFDDESRAATRQAERIGSKSETKLFDNGTFILKADHASHSKGASLIGDTEINGDLDNVWTSQRVKILNQSAENFKSTTSKTIPIKIDHNHLVKAFISSEHYHYISSTNTRADICLMMHAKSGLILKQEADIFFPLKFDLELEKNVMYYAGFNRGSYFSWTPQKYKTVVIPLSISKEELVNNLFMFKFTDNGIYWKGTYTENTTAEEVDGKIWATLGEISIVTAIISNGVVKDWFYGNQGKSVYVDFIYKGGVTLV